MRNVTARIVAVCLVHSRLTSCLAVTPTSDHQSSSSAAITLRHQDSASDNCNASDEQDKVHVDSSTRDGISPVRHLNKPTCLL